MDICSPSYGQKKGRESNWQFDSRPLKVGNRPLPDIRFGSAIRRWKDLDEGYNFGSDLVAIGCGSRELWAPKVPGLQSRQFRDNFGTISGLQLGSPGNLCHLDVASAASCRVYYMGDGGGFPQGCLGMWTNHFVVGFGCRFKLDLLVPLPSLIPGLPTRPSTPF